jgi:hypothetical protein
LVNANQGLSPKLLVILAEELIRQGNKVIVTFIKQIQADEFVGSQGENR